MNTITIPPAMESTVALWLAGAGGLAVWTNKDAISPGRGRQRLQPGNIETPPNVSFGAKPDFIITDPAHIRVEQWQEFKRIKIRQSTNPRGVSRADQALIDAAKTAAGNSATSRIDYSDPLAKTPWCMAVIEIPAPPRPFNPQINERIHP